MYPFQGITTNLWSCYPQGGVLLTLGYPMQPFQGKKLKIPHRASSQQTDAALSRLQVLGSRMNHIYSREFKHHGIYEMLL